MSQEVEQRITELEIRFSHQLQLLEELNEELTKANQRIEDLRQDNRRLSELVRQLPSDLLESPDE